MTAKEEAQKRFADGGFGVISHWLGRPDMSAEAWDRRVDAFDVNGFAAQLAEAGAAHLIFTLGQNSGHYASPNATYALLTAVLPCKCSSRDLIADLHEALAPYDIRLFVYLPSGAPAQDEAACQALGWEWGYDVPWPRMNGHVLTGQRLAGFQVKWEAVIREWSRRWERKVEGWWIDGCYFADAMYRSALPPNFKSLAAALRSGNPDALLAFNPGVRFPLTPFATCEDYTAGEFDRALPEITTWVDTTDENPIPHVLGYLGNTWGRGDKPRFSDDLVTAYTAYVKGRGGVVTWDVPLSETGQIAAPFKRQLAQVRQFISKETHPA